MPDSMTVTMMQDKEDAVDLVTYLQDGKDGKDVKILLKIGNRFMLFDDTGKFIDEIEFKMSPQEKQGRWDSSI